MFTLFNCTPLKDWSATKITAISPGPGSSKFFSKQPRNHDPPGDWHVEWTDYPAKISFSPQQDWQTPVFSPSQDMMLFDCRLDDLGQNSSPFTWRPNLDRKRYADTSTRWTLVDHWKRHTVNTEPVLRGVYWRILAQQHLLEAGFQIRDDGFCTFPNRSLRLEHRLDSRNNGSTQHGNPSLSEETSLCERWITHSVL